MILFAWVCITLNKPLYCNRYRQAFHIGAWQGFSAVAWWRANDTSIEVFMKIGRSQMSAAFLNQINSPIVIWHAHFCRTHPAEHLQPVVVKDRRSNQCGKDEMRSSNAFYFDSRRAVRPNLRALTVPE